MSCVFKFWLTFRFSFWGVYMGSFKGVWYFHCQSLPGYSRLSTSKSVGNNTSKSQGFPSNYVHVVFGNKRCRTSEFRSQLTLIYGGPNWPNVLIYPSRKKKTFPSRNLSHSHGKPYWPIGKGWFAGSYVGFPGRYFRFYGTVNQVFHTPLGSPNGAGHSLRRGSSRSLRSLCQVF